MMEFLSVGLVDHVEPTIRHIERIFVRFINEPELESASADIGIRIQFTDIYIYRVQRIQDVYRGMCGETRLRKNTLNIFTLDIIKINDSSSKEWRYVKTKFIIYNGS